jgi:hypothetical protein
MSNITRITFDEREIYIGGQVPESNNLDSNNEPIVLSPEDTLKLLELIENPPPPTPAYLKAQEDYKRLIRKSC